MHLPVDPTAQSHDLRHLPRTIDLHLLLAKSPPGLALFHLRRESPLERPVPPSYVVELHLAILVAHARADWAIPPSRGGVRCLHFQVTGYVGGIRLKAEDAELRRIAIGFGSELRDEEVTRGPPPLFRLGVVRRGIQVGLEEHPGVYADVRPDVEEDVAASVGELRGPPPPPAAAPSAISLPSSHLAGGRIIAGIDDGPPTADASSAVPPPPLPPSSSLAAGGGRSVGVEVCTAAVRQGRAQIR